MKKQFTAPSDSVKFKLPSKHDAIPVSRPRVLSSDLLGTARELVIEHDGEEYRLRLTRLDKLILTK
jgi:hemin uptake protein HemP